jgi:hypothetical protein
LNAEENNLCQFQRIIELFTQKFVTKLSKLWVWDPRSGIRKKPFPDPGPGPGVKKAPDPDQQHEILRGRGLFHVLGTCITLLLYYLKV